MRKGFSAFLIQIALLVTASVVLAVGDANFGLAAALPLAGVTGLAALARHFWGLPIGWTILFINIPLALLSWKRLGRSFLMRSLFCTAVYALSVQYVAPLLPTYTGDRLLASACTGVIAGAACTLIYMKNASTGGMDFLVVSLKSWFPFLSVGSLFFTSAVLVLGLEALVFHDVDGFIYGLGVNCLTSLVMNRMILGTNIGKLLLVVSPPEKGSAVCQAIDKVSGRGSTLIYAHGGYQGAPKQIVMCACGSRQVYRIIDAVKKMDPASFTVILDSQEVHGDGFHTIKIG